MTYEPENLGTYSDEEISQLVEILSRELNRVSIGFTNVSSLLLEELHVAPAKPRTGLTVLADGTNWNPGAGQGVYTFYNNTWNKLG